jgi:hypothetical protein
MNIGKNFICSISKKHLLKETKILPCNSLVCSKCVQYIINTIQKCPCCENQHSTYVLSRLSSDPDVDSLIKFNSEVITQELKEKLNQKILSLEGLNWLFFQGFQILFYNFRIITKL